MRICFTNFIYDIERFLCIFSCGGCFIDESMTASDFKKTIKMPSVIGCKACMTSERDSELKIKLMFCAQSASKWLLTA